MSNGWIRNELVEEGLMTVAEVAAFLGLGKSTLYQLMEAGHLVFVKLGRARRIPKRAVFDLAAANLKGGWSTVPSKGGFDDN